ncbi:MAG: acyltransferase family protein [Clostridia bacterium]|nr:acyltransferase family protein [Clostridia bacterium]
MKTTTRNGYVDFLRGIAMLLVVLGHTMTGVTADFQGSVLFNIVWSLQMPMFILISGYVTRFNRKADSFSGLFKVLGRRTVAYLLPCIIWTLFVRCLILGQFSVDDLKTLLWHTDKGYWFLLTIWTISAVFEISRFISDILIKPKNKAVGILLTGVFYGVGFGLLAALGKLMGLSFFGIKLTLYYMPWFFLGFLYGVFRDRLHCANNTIAKALLLRFLA